MQDNLCLSITFNFSWSSLTRSLDCCFSSDGLWCFSLHPSANSPKTWTSEVERKTKRQQFVFFGSENKEKVSKRNSTNTCGFDFPDFIQNRETFTLLPLVVCPQIIEENGRATIGYPFGFIYCTRIKYQVSRGFRGLQMLFGDLLGDKNSHQVE
jgi:hypothetical protein